MNTKSPLKYFKKLLTSYNSVLLSHNMGQLVAKIPFFEDKINPLIMKLKINFWSPNHLVVETLGVASVRMSVQDAFSQKPFITFFLKLYTQFGLVSARNFSKRFFDNFHHFGQKISKIGHLAGCWVWLDAGIAGNPEKP